MRDSGIPEVTKRGWFSSLLTSFAEAGLGDENCLEPRTRSDACVVEFPIRSDESCPFSSLPSKPKLVPRNLNRSDENRSYLSLCWKANVIVYFSAVLMENRNNKKYDHGMQELIQESGQWKVMNLDGFRHFSPPQGTFRVLSLGFRVRKMRVTSSGSWLLKLNNVDDSDGRNIWADEKWWIMMIFVTSPLPRARLGSWV